MIGFFPLFSLYFYITQVQSSRDYFLLDLEGYDMSFNDSIITRQYTYR